MQTWRRRATCPGCNQPDPADPDGVPAMQKGFVPRHERTRAAYSRVRWTHRARSGSAGVGSRVMNDKNNANADRTAASVCEDSLQFVPTVFWLTPRRFLPGLPSWHHLFQCFSSRRRRGCSSLLCRLNNSRNRGLLLRLLRHRYLLDLDFLAGHRLGPLHLYSHDRRLGDEESFARRPAVGGKDGYLNAARTHSERL
jgi:hypothetical protein